MFDDAKLEKAPLVLFTEAGSIVVKAIEDIHYIFVTGKQLNEPIAWGGPRSDDRDLYQAPANRGREIHSAHGQEVFH